MEKMSFVSRETANAANIYNDMLKDKDCTIFLTLAGSTSAAGCMNIYKDLVKYNMVDAIVATGASIVDMDFFEALGFKHYQGSQFQDDTELRNNYIVLGQLGAYGLTFRSQFNGYYSDLIFEVEDKPIMTMYDKDINKATLVA